MLDYPRPGKGKVIVFEWASEGVTVPC